MCQRKNITRQVTHTKIIHHARLPQGEPHLEHREQLFAEGIVVLSLRARPLLAEKNAEVQGQEKYG